MEFGLRRAQGPDAGTYGARAAVIAGCVGTSNVLCGQLFDVPVKGTHAHSWIMSFPDELTAFKTYGDMYPNACILLADTYDTLKSGVPNAIKTFQYLRDKGTLGKGYGIRLDSGDLAYISKKARKMLDDAGFPDAIISASNDLDEHLIDSLKNQGATITSRPGYGLTQGHGGRAPLLPFPEPVCELYTGLAQREEIVVHTDLICLQEETFTTERPLVLFDPAEPWKKTRLEAGEFELRDLLVPLFIDGECVYTSPKTMDIRKQCLAEQDTLWEESRRLVNPHQVYVDLSRKLYDTKLRLLDEVGEKHQGIQS